ncbi:YgfZ/GcvT domain-containing protein [Paludibacterium yongneupense]|uniref:CAF17-like 4Fe-4S cluster assembly/insertion protein YgfZ n=1 Tax=Paludibacterium yongneupense TaxID=400061 RepID=UPI0004001FD0|nr:folate-binding protein YgfZ [Paludibacterium yongneupense]
MNTQWQAWFNRHGVVFDGNAAVGFAEYEQQLSALKNGAVVSALNGFSVIRVTGDDAQSFLQGQFSSDILAIDETNSQLSSYSTAKGRMQATMLIWRQHDAYFLLVSSDIALAFCKRLSMFILRSKVKAEVVGGECILLGLAGAAAENAAGDVPFESGAVASRDGGIALRLPNDALMLALTPEAAADVLARLGDDVVPVSAEVWGILDIDAGIPWVTSATVEQFVPQMANMDLLGAVSFKKGCYPGQEIVARTHYLGKVKRRLYRVRIPEMASSGDSLYSPGSADQAIGQVVNVSRETSGCVALAVVQSSRWEDGVFLRGLDGVRLEKLSLPYSIDDE